LSGESGGIVRVSPLSRRRARVAQSTSGSLPNTASHTPQASLAVRVSSAFSAIPELCQPLCATALASGSRQLLQRLGRCSLLRAPHGASYSQLTAFAPCRLAERNLARSRRYSLSAVSPQPPRARHPVHVAPP